MKRSHLQNAAICVAGATAAILAAQKSAADVTYMVTKLVDLDFLPVLNFDDRKDDIFAINDAGDIVGSFIVEGKRHAFVWLQENRYGLSQGVRDIHALADSGTGLPEDESVAHDINDVGTVVGHAGGTLVGEGEGIVWRLSDSVGTCRLGFYIEPEPGGPQFEPWSAAHAINDDDPPIIIGDMLTVYSTQCSHYYNDGFRAVFDFVSACPDVTLDPLGAFLGDNGAYARDLTDTPKGGNAAIVGFSHIPALPICGSDLCLTEMDAIKWPPVIPVSAIPRMPLSSGGHDGRGINASGRIVGSGRVNPADPCGQRALLWATSTSEPTVLGNTMPGGQEGDDSHAEAITDTALARVVGWNALEKFALMWVEVSEDQWEVRDLNDEIGTCAGNLPIMHAHDINADSWIIGVANANPGGLTDAYAVLLTPVETCRWDIAPPDQLDGEVSVVDFLQLLAQWGPCPPADFCTADYDCTGDVGETDFLELLAHWGPCDGDSAASPPQWLLGLVDIVGFDNPALLEALICAAAPDVCQE